MKKAFSLILVFAMLFSLYSCAAPKLTDAQKDCCSEADEFLSDLANELDLKFSKKIKTINDKYIYIATLNIDGDFTDKTAKLFADRVAPLLEEILHKENIYIALYLSEKGSEEYRIIDSLLDPGFLD